MVNAVHINNTVKMRIESVDELRRTVALGGLLKRFSVEAIDLPAAIEVATWHAAGGIPPESEVAEWVQKWRAEHHILERACSVFEASTQDNPPLYGAPRDEIRLVPTAEEYANDSDLEWSAFRQRFERSLKENGGFDRRLALALSGALAEMVDNVIQHSGIPGSRSARGAVGYEVADGQMRFVVADIGCGVLESLRRNPEHVGLATHKDALRAAVIQHATARPGVRAGDGFGQVLRSLSGLGSVRFRSGDSLLTLEDTRDARSARFATSATMKGLQLVVKCRKKEQTSLL